LYSTTIKFFPCIDTTKNLDLGASFFYLFFPPALPKNAAIDLGTFFSFLFFFLFFYALPKTPLYIGAMMMMMMMMIIIIIIIIIIAQVINRKFSNIGCPN